MRAHVQRGVTDFENDLTFNTIKIIYCVYVKYCKQYI